MENFNGDDDLRSGEIRDTAPTSATIDEETPSPADSDYIVVDHPPIMDESGELLDDDEVAPAETPISEFGENPDVEVGSRPHN